MKKIFVLILAIVIVGLGGAYLMKSGSNNALGPVPTPNESVLSATPLPGGDIYATKSFSGDQVTLIPNFVNPKTSEEIMKESACTYLVNGGFYTTDSKPVGLFMTGDTTIREAHTSSLFDGFITINKIGIPRITRTLPKDPLRIAMQVGPILIENGKALHLAIRNDHEERRVVAAITGENELLFIVLQNVKLAEIAERLVSWTRAESINLADVVNLDGGSASTIRTPDFVLPEVSPIGSAFCVKE